MKRRYVTVDVFTDVKFGGNPLAVVLDAEGLDSDAMQAIAREFNYSETTFVLPPADPAHAAHVRIYTPNEELPFAGHPNVGTAYALARIGSVFGHPIGGELVFEEAAGNVPIRIERHAGEPVGAELTAPQDLAVGSMVAPVAVAECLGIPLDEIVITGHMPVVAGVGTGFVIAEVHSTATLAKMRPDAGAFARHLPVDGTAKVLAYTPTGEASLQTRMFFAVPDVREDPATGSANAALAALLAALGEGQDGLLRLSIAQGVEMGRPSLLRARVEKFAGQVVSVHIGGNCVPVMEGLLDV